MTPTYVDLALVGALLVARYVFGVPCFEWYVPGRVVRWIERGEHD